MSSGGQPSDDANSLGNSFTVLQRGDSEYTGALTEGATVVPEEEDFRMVAPVAPAAPAASANVGATADLLRRELAAAAVRCERSVGVGQPWAVVETAPASSNAGATPDLLRRELASAAARCERSVGVGQPWAMVETEFVPIS